MNPATPPSLPALLADALSSSQAQGGGGVPRLAVLPAALRAQLAATDGGSAPAAASQAGAGRAGQLSRGMVRRLAGLAKPAARAILARPRVKRLVLDLLARSPRLYARAYQVMLQPAAAPAQATAPAPLSPRALALFQALGRDAAPAGAPVNGAADPARLVAQTRTALRERADAGAGAARPRLAFVSPLPPERTGIADYAVQLLPDLCRHFDIELVVSQGAIALPPELATLPVRDLDWFARHAARYDQILYQFGNSEFHSHMFELLARHPGVVVLHDFFLSNVLAFKQVAGDPPSAWNDALFHSHGYAALRESQDPARRAATLKTYPCNRAVLDAATGVIVHSEHAAQLAQRWYGRAATDNWTTVPLPRSAPPAQDRAAARAALGIAEDVFLVCSFGYIGPNKLTHRLLEAWLASSLAPAPDCQLVLVGANHASPYGTGVADTIRAAGPGAGIRIAGWTDDTVYRLYLQAADMAVQLRTSAQGETSAAVLDCMNYGLATIVNANGSMAALPEDAVWRLDDEFDGAALVAALESLRADGGRRGAIGARAAALLERDYRPARCAREYGEALARAHAAQAVGEPALLRALAALPAAADEATRVKLAMHLARSRPPLMPRQLLVDVTALRRDGAHTPARRGALRQVLALLADTDPGLRVEPVYLDQVEGVARFRYARAYTGRLLDIVWSEPGDLPVDAWPGDLFYSPDASPDAAAPGRAAALAALRADGVALGLLVLQAAASDAAWLAAAVRAADCLLCEDAAQATALAARLAQQSGPRAAGEALGADRDGL